MLSKISYLRGNLVEMLGVTVKVGKAESNKSVGGQLGSALFILMLLASAGNSWPAALLAVSSLRMIYILNALRRGDLAH